MSDTKPTARAMRAAEAVICDEGRRRDIPAVATIIDKAAGLPALEQCRDLLEEIATAYRVADSVRSALAEAGKGRAG